ncbi:protein Z-dependent protease inhibitor-like isoform X2 [Lampris incognitus]|nr:protein Z-dependent protease inhibitor-like isoform X2 [Lampris incognitus]
MSGTVCVFLGSLMLLAAAQDPVQDLSNRNADFAARLYRVVSSRTDENIFLSPFTLSMGLSALMNGADGSTRQQLLRGLNLASLDPQQIPDLFLSLKNSITGGGAFPLRQGIAVLPAQRFTVTSAYLDLVQNKYGGNSQSLSYNSPQEVQSTINSWAQTQTGDQVQDMVFSVKDQTQLLLVTAVYYQSQFTLAFNASFTQEERFYVDKFHIVQVPMMFRSDKYHLAYDSSLKTGILKLPMSDGAAMLVILPDENVDIATIEEEITAERLQGWLRQLKKTKLEVQLPRFLLERSYSLQDVLTGLDIREVFQDDADLSPITGTKGLKLTEVLHKAVINVDESSSTGEGGRGGINVFASLPPRLTINRPFIFFIYHQKTNSLLFVGRVVDPTQK